MGAEQIGHSSSVSSVSSVVNPSSSSMLIRAIRGSKLPQTHAQQLAGQHPTGYLYKPSIAGTAPWSTNLYGGAGTFIVKQSYLEITYRHGRPLAAYLYLPRRDGDTSASTRKAENGLLVDLTADGRAIGIEITSPRRVTAACLNNLLRELGCAELKQEELSPLVAA